MSGLLGLAGSVAIVAGLVFVLGGVLGVLRLPDFYTRLHALGKCDTLGVGLMVVGLALGCDVHDGLKMIVIVLFVLLAGPLATHALARAAWRSGLEPHRAEQDRG